MPDQTYAARLRERATKRAFLLALSPPDAIAIADALEAAQVLLEVLDNDMAMGYRQSRDDLGDKLAALNRRDGPEE